MEDPLQCIAALAPTLKEAELRCLLELTRRADENRQVLLSSRQLAEAAGVSRSNVQTAIDSLNERGLIVTDGGSASRASGHRLLYLDTVVLPGRGLIAGPPPAEKSSVGGLIAGPQVALFQGQGGPVTEPGVASQQGQGGLTIEPPILRARESIEIDAERAIDRLLKATPKKYDPGKLLIARQWLHGYMAKFGRQPNPHPPPDDLCAQFLSIAEWPRLEGMLYDLMAEHREAGEKYVWFITVGLQRIWGISPERQKQVRADLRLVGAKRPDDFSAQVAALAAGKAFR